MKYESVAAVVRQCDNSVGEVSNSLKSMSASTQPNFPKHSTFNSGSNGINQYIPKYRRNQKNYRHGN